MSVAMDLPGIRGPEEQAGAKRAAVVGKAQEILNRYKIGTEPDFEFLSELIYFSWTETTQPELIGLSAEDAAKKKAELAEQTAQREAEFIKQQYQRLLERRGQQSGG